MIQRIQTLYLLIVALLAITMNFVSLGMFTTETASFNLTTCGVSTLESGEGLAMSTWALCALMCVIALLTFCSMFLFKKRILQMRMIGFSMLLWVGFGVATALFVSIIGGELHASFRMGLPLALPLVALILDWLAIRSIGADEALVRSLDRIR